MHGHPPSPNMTQWARERASEWQTTERRHWHIKNAKWAIQLGGNGKQLGHLLQGREAWIWFMPQCSTFKSASLFWFILFYFIFRFCSTQVIWVTSKISTFVLHGIGNSIWFWNDIRTSLCFGWCFPLNSLKTCQNTIWWWLGRWHELKWVVSAAWAVS